MKTRSGILAGLLLLLIAVYVVGFTDWLRPAPIGIVSQVRFSVIAPRFGRPAKQPFAGSNIVEKQIKPGPQPDTKGSRTQTGSGPPPPPVASARNKSSQPAPHPIENLEQAPGGVANVSFALDGWYQLTRVWVEDVPSDGSKSHVAWSLVGKSIPVNWLIYGHQPEGMRPILPGSPAENLQAGVPYRLILQAGRRRGTNDFRTIDLNPPQ